jgi:uncharacterized coiled-coil DUF342 family protein
MALNELLDELESKARKIRQRMDRMEEENRSLRQSVFQYLQQLDEQKKELDELKAQLATRQLAGEFKHTHKELQRKIELYIGMIDKCIATIQVNTLKE